jgi:hypothetical protein
MSRERCRDCGYPKLLQVKCCTCNNEHWRCRCESDQPTCRACGQQGAIIVRGIAVPPEEATSPDEDTPSDLSAYVTFKDAMAACGCSAWEISRACKDAVPFIGKGPGRLVHLAELWRYLNDR